MRRNEALLRVVREARSWDIQVVYEAGVFKFEK